jgi:precorrin-6A/cobalt-precorrin-6A reductase
MIWIIGGTAETARVIASIRGQAAYIVTVATETGRAMLPDDSHTLVARLDYAAMLAFLQARDIRLTVDLSHPYAATVSRNARRACQTANVRYIRFIRAPSDVAGAVYLASTEDCVAWLRAVRGCVFFTTGSTHIAEFQQVRGDNRFVYRVLPTPESLAACAANQVALSDIVALLGPVSAALNAAMFAEYQAAYVVMKNSGQAGGTPEKLTACQQLGITPVIIGRPPDEGVSDLEAVVHLIVTESRMS